MRKSPQRSGLSGDISSHEISLMRFELPDAQIKIDGAERTICTLVNGAGLAMNTVDALALHGDHAANFPDTGGEAISETVKRSFELILQDDRVKVIVNHFGGLTLGDMIARDVLLAFKELDVGSKVPVAVRIRGTNEKEGEQIIADSGLQLFAYCQTAKSKEVMLVSELSA
jgi:succinyl-CoA synthetase alpha subunit